MNLLIFIYKYFLGTPQLSDSTDVEITVTDVNDNPPKFSQESYLVSVSEDVPIGTSILQVSVFYRYLTLVILNDLFCMIK